MGSVFPIQLHAHVIHRRLILQIIGANKIHGQILIKKIDAGEEIFPPLKVNSNNYDEQMNPEKEDFEITSWNDSHEGML